MVLEQTCQNEHRVNISQEVSLGVSAVTNDLSCHIQQLLTSAITNAGHNHHPHTLIFRRTCVSQVSSLSQCESLDHFPA